MFSKKCKKCRNLKNHFLTTIARSFDLERSQSIKIKTRDARLENVFFQDPFWEPKFIILGDFFVFDELLTKKYVV